MTLKLQIISALTLGLVLSFMSYPNIVSGFSSELIQQRRSGSKVNQKFLYATKLWSQSTPILPEEGLATEEQITQYASSVGLKLSLTTLGPGYRALARASHDESQIIGYCEGFIRPGGKIIHVDKLEVWKKALSTAKKENPDGFKNGGQVFGVSLLLGYMCLLHGYDKGCSIAEFLAIDDEAFQHKRLVRFFKRAGFNVIKYVGDDLASVPDRLVWGGCGTLMNEEIEKLLLSWTKTLFRSKDS